MPDLLTLTGIVATTPRHLTTNSGLEITSFRLASSQRRYDRAQNKWVDTDTNWYTVTAFRHLAANLVGSIERGQHVLVTGRLRIRAWENGEKSGLTIEVEADAVGHDLSWGTSVYTRSVTTGSPGGGATAPVDSWAQGGEASLPGSASASSTHDGAEGGQPGGPAGDGSDDGALEPVAAESALLPF